MIIRRVAFGLMCLVVFAIQYGTIRDSGTEIDSANGPSIGLTALVALSSVAIIRLITRDYSIQNKFIDMAFRAVFHTVYMYFAGFMIISVYQVVNRIPGADIDLMAGSAIFIPSIIVVSALAHRYWLAQKVE